MLDDVLVHPRDIVYLYNSCLDILPEQFASRNASSYLAAMELLSDYPNNFIYQAMFAIFLLANKRLEKLLNICTLC